MRGGKNLWTLAILVFVFVGFCGCEAVSEPTKQAEAPTQNETVALEQNPAGAMVQTETAASPDYASLFNQINVLQRDVLSRTSDITAREILVKAAVDQSRRKLYVVGEGAPNAEQAGASETLLMQGAERAAVVDAQRWALLVLSWAKNANTPAPNGQVSGTVPPHVVVYKAQLPDKTMQVLIEVSL